MGSGPRVTGAVEMALVATITDPAVGGTCSIDDARQLSCYLAGRQGELARVGWIASQ